MGQVTLPNKTTQIHFDGETEQVSDGYHTFKELYDHRIELFIALCRVIHNTVGREGGYLRYKVWRSTTHSDGSQIPGWFIMGIGREKGEQITYHLPAARWHDTDFILRDGNAPEWDGHTSADVLERLKQL